MADVTRLHKLVRKANGVEDFQRAGLNASGTAVIGRPSFLSTIRQTPCRFSSAMNGPGWPAPTTNTQVSVAVSDMLG
jgi:hypothetical protein